MWTHLKQQTKSGYRYQHFDPILYSPFSGFKVPCKMLQMLDETFEGKYIKSRDRVLIWNSGAQTLSHRARPFKATGIALSVWIKGWATITFMF